MLIPDNIKILSIAGIILLMFSIQPFVGVANKGRYEAFCFLLKSAATLFTVRKIYLLSAFIGIKAIESHPMAVIGLAYQIKKHLYTYFFETPFMAHLPTLVLTGIGLIFFIKRHTYFSSERNRFTSMAVLVSRINLRMGAFDCGLMTLYLHIRISGLPGQIKISMA